MILTNLTNLAADLDFTPYLKWLEATGVATRIREGLYLFPVLESIHVLALALVFGTIAVVDLRLLGLASVQRSFTKIGSDILKWTWIAFSVSVVTGALMFMTNAEGYYHNFYFRTKTVLLILAGINMMAFELTAGRTVRRWDNAPSAPMAGKAAAAVSIVLWVGIIFMGRMVGFTTTGKAVVAKPAPTNINFDDFLGGGGPAPGGPAPTAPAK